MHAETGAAEPLHPSGVRDEESGCQLAAIMPRSQRPSAPIEDVPAAVFLLIAAHLSSADGDQFRRASVGLRDLHDSSWRARSFAGERWALTMRDVSRKFLRVGRALAVWFCLNLVCFPFLLLWRVLRVAAVPLWLIFLPTWLALFLSLATAWAAAKALGSTSNVMAVQRHRRRPLLHLERDSAKEARVFVALHMSMSMPLPFVHVAYLCGVFLPGCLLALAPSLVLSFGYTAVVLHQRCRVRSICGMLSSVALILEWCYFPACVLPEVDPLPLRWFAIMWLTPVTMPYILLFCAALSQRAWTFAVATASAYAVAVCLHAALLGAGRVGEALACVFLTICGSTLTVRFWKWAAPNAAVGVEQVQSVFAAIRVVLEDDDDHSSVDSDGVE